MTPSLDSDVIGTLPLTYEASFKVPTTIPGGNYVLPVVAVDENGRSATATIPVIVDTTSAGAGTPPQFSGRLEAKPTIAALGGDVAFFVGAQDLDGTDTIEQVVIDLVSIGGSIPPLGPAVGPVQDSAQP